jgi:hypothetical protein
VNHVISAAKSAEHWMARFLHHPAPSPSSPKEKHVMKQVFSFTVAAFVLGAAIASSQTPPAAQAPTPAPAQPAAGQAQPAEPRAAAPRTTTYKGILKGSATSGWTLSPVRSASGTAGATATAGGADAVTYSIVTADGSKVDLAAMADKCVEVGGVLAPAAGGDAKAANRTFTVATIKSAEDCK